MKRALLFSFYLSLLLFGYPDKGKAQPQYNLQLIEVTNNCTYLDLKIQISSSSTSFDLYDANLVFEYTGSFTGTPTLVQKFNFDGTGAPSSSAYSPMTFTRPWPTFDRMSLNIVHNAGPYNNPSVSTAWVDVATVRFSVATPNTAYSITWKTSGPGRTYVYQAPGGPTNLLTGGTLTGITTGSINARPSAPTSGGDQTVCNGQSYPALTVTVGSGTTADWYANSSGGSAIATGTLSYTPSSAGTYYAEARNITSGCISTSRTGVTLTVIPLKLDVKAYLQGPWNAGAGSMNTVLNSSSLLPTTQPYSSYSSHSYSGTESVSSTTWFALYPTIVDWVLVELRTGTPTSPPMTSVETRAGFILSTGHIVATDGTSPLTFWTATPGNNYYITVYHRNHLGIMSASSVSMPCSSSATSYDFTTAQSQAYNNGNNPMIQISTGVYGMIAGDANGNGFVGSSDVILWRFYQGYFDYLGADANMSGFVNSTDLNIYIRPNQGLATQVP
jgi:hypothetical protein